MAHFNLKSIFASSNKYTILQLLKELCETIDNQEFSMLYLHKITIKDYNDDALELYVINNSDTSLVGKYGNDLFNALLNAIDTKYYESMNVQFNPITHCRVISEGVLIGMYTEDGYVGKTLVGAVLTDTVTQL